MQRIFATKLLLTKLILLGCFSLMGLGEVLANKPVPCHEVADDTQQECPICPLAFDAWDAETSLETPTVTLAVESEFLSSFVYNDALYQGVSSVLKTHPPPQLLSDTALLAFNTVRLIL